MVVDPKSVTGSVSGRVSHHSLIDRGRVSQAGAAIPAGRRECLRHSLNRTLARAGLQPSHRMREPRLMRRVRSTRPQRSARIALPVERGHLRDNGVMMDNVLTLLCVGLMRPGRFLIRCGFGGIAGWLSPVVRLFMRASECVGGGSQGMCVQTKVCFCVCVCVIEG